MTPEGLIKRQICDWLFIHDYFFWMQSNVGVAGRKFKSPYQRKGVSDILGIWEGSMLAIEVKAPGGKVSEDQYNFIAMVNKLGGNGFVAYSLRDVILALKGE
jgi:hypothetical protein